MEVERECWRIIYVLWCVGVGGGNREGVERVLKFPEAILSAGGQP